MPVLNIERIASIAAKEAIRQKVGLDGLARLLDAYNLAYHLAQSGELFGIEDIRWIACKVEPLTGGNFRSTAVTFANMSTAVSAAEVPDSMARLVKVNIAAQQAGLRDRWIKDFLDVHPFVDGNGRTAWILRTWLFNDWGYPSELPDYYG